MIIIITGSYGFIGTYLKKRLQEEGHTVIDFDINDPKYPVDATKEQEVIYYFSKVSKEHPHVDALINCIGIPNSANKLPYKDITEIPTESFESLIDINLTAVFTIVREFVRYYGKTITSSDTGTDNKQRIVNISSLYSVISPRLDLYDGSIKHPGYVASKYGLVGLSQYLSVLLASRRMTVNCIAPAAVAETVGVEGDFVNKYLAQVPMKCTIPMNEIFNTLKMLLTSDCITGQNLVIDGGYTSW